MVCDQYDAFPGLLLVYEVEDDEGEEGRGEEEEIVMKCLGD